MQTAIIIPVRYGSTRFPGKPLAQISGHSMLERVWRIASAASTTAKVFIATDDERIAEAAKTLGASVVMTPKDCLNGGERVLAALKNLNLPDLDVVVNFQGDAVLTPPWIVAELINAFHKDPQISIATPAVRLNPEASRELSAAKQSGSSSGTLVTFDKVFNALYFSKSFIPYRRGTAAFETAPVYRHIGMYAYRPAVLEKLNNLPETELERSEGLEQLRALENQIPIRIVPVDYRGRSHASVDNPEDIAVVEKIIAAEGELLTWT